MIIYELKNMTQCSLISRKTVDPFTTFNVEFKKKTKIYECSEM